MALPTQIQLQIVSADRSLVNETVDEVEIPGVDGYFGVLPGHTPLLALLGTGIYAAAFIPCAFSTASSIVPTM